MLSNIELESLKKSALNVRRNIVKMVHNAKSGHPGGSLSGVDILTVLYQKALNIPTDWNKSNEFENRDRFILSKGHASPLLYAIHPRANTHLPSRKVYRSSLSASSTAKSAARPTAIMPVSRSMCRLHAGT